MLAVASLRRARRHAGVACCSGGWKHVTLHAIYEFSTHTHTHTTTHTHTQTSRSVSQGLAQLQERLQLLHCRGLVPPDLLLDHVMHARRSARRGAAPRVWRNQRRHLRRRLHSRRRPHRATRALRPALREVATAACVRSGGVPPPVPREVRCEARRGCETRRGEPRVGGREEAVRGRRVAVRQPRVDPPLLALGLRT